MTPDNRDIVYPKLRGQSYYYFTKLTEGYCEMAMGNVINDDYFIILPSSCYIHIYQTYRTLLGNCSPLHTRRPPVFSPTMLLFKNGSYLQFAYIECNTSNYFTSSGKRLIFGSNRSPRRGNVVCPCVRTSVILFKRSRQVSR